jgi:uncharacterized protein (DUF305 family)
MKIPYMHVAALAAVLLVAPVAPAHAQAAAAADSDLVFIDGMIAHHQQAIDEAKAIQARAQRPEVKKLAADIIRAQQAEIDQLRSWRRAWFPDAPEAQRSPASGMRMGAEAPAGMPHGPGQAGAMQPGAGMHSGASKDPDLAFVEMMIPHHRDAVAMSEQILKTTKRPEIRQLAQNIIRDQQKEIALMERWQKEWGAAPK